MKRNAMQETRAQRYRALANLKDGEEALLCLGVSSTQVKEHYALPWFDLFDEEVRDDTVEIFLQKWIGPPDRGHWVTQTTLPFPRQLQVAS